MSIFVDTLTSTLNTCTVRAGLCSFTQRSHHGYKTNSRTNARAFESRMGRGQAFVPLSVKRFLAIAHQTVLSKEDREAGDRAQ